MTLPRPSAPVPAGRTVEPGDRCPCLSGTTYAECCLPAHLGVQPAPTAERLMRSRYSAFVVGDAAYLRSSWHPSTRPATIDLDPTQHWYRLDIVNRTAGGMLDRTGTVEFVAHYRHPAGPQGGTVRGELRETSTFARHRGEWFYVSGEHPPMPAGERA
ncbi:YchJ family protein [Subtercola sp. Z020]|uniref:YchJ family protein n=1 Tax=Subtercola sp. Z020 TaxID=2080582 RepID=UPI00268E9E9C